MTTIKRKLAALNLKRKNYEAEVDLEYFVAAVIVELYSSGYNLGYRSMWQKVFRKYGLRIRRDTVYKILKLADPEGVVIS